MIDTLSAHGVKDPQNYVLKKTKNGIPLYEKQLPSGTKIRLGIDSKDGRAYKSVLTTKGNYIKSLYPCKYSELVNKFSSFSKNLIIKTNKLKQNFTRINDISVVSENLRKIMRGHWMPVK